MTRTIGCQGIRLLLAAAFVLIGGCAASDRSVSAPGAGPVPPSLPSVIVTGDSAESQAQAMAVRAALSRAAYVRSVSESLLLKVDYAAAAPAAIERPPLNIALVLDRSGSMAEDRKFPYTMAAARLVIESMTDRDILSIVAFNHEVVVLAAAGRVVNKQFLYHRLEEISPQGYTDLSAGLLEGIAQVDSQRAEGQFAHVFLLTDGLANRGITSSAALRNIVEKACGRGIGLSTFGCGTEFIGSSSK